MIEIIVLIYILNWFYKTAKGLNKNPLIWVLIALFSYLGPVLIISFIVYPSLTIGWITTTINEKIYQLILLPINLIFGISGVLIVKVFLKYGHLKEFTHKKINIFICVAVLMIVLISLIYYSYKYMNSHPENIIIHKNLDGVKKMENFNYRQSIYDFNDLIKQYPNEHTAYYNRGIAYLMLKSYDSARVDFIKVINLNSYSSQNEQFFTYRYLGECYFLTNKPDSAIHYFEIAQKISPDNKIVLIKLLELYVNNKKSNEFCKLLKSIDINSIQSDLPYSVKRYSEYCK